VKNPLEITAGHGWFSASALCGARRVAWSMGKIDWFLWESSMTSWGIPYK